MQRLAPQAHIDGSGTSTCASDRSSTSTPKSDAWKRPATATCRRCSNPATSPCAAACSMSTDGRGRALPRRTVRRRDRTIRAFDSGDPALASSKVEAVRPAARSRSPARRGCARRRRACRLRERFDIDTRRSALYQDLKARRHAGAASSTTCRCSSTQTATLFDYLADDTLLGARRRRARCRRSLLDADRRTLRAASPRYRAPAAAAVGAVPAAGTLARAAEQADPRRRLSHGIARMSTPCRSATSRRRSCRSIARTRNRRTSLKSFLASVSGTRADRRGFGRPSRGAARAAGRSGGLRPVAGRRLARLPRPRRRRPRQRFAITVAPLERRLRPRSSRHSPSSPNASCSRERAAQPIARRRRRPRSGSDHPRPRRARRRRADRARGPRRRPLPRPGHARRRRHAGRIPRRSSTPRATACTCRSRSCT